MQGTILRRSIRFSFSQVKFLQYSPISLQLKLALTAYTVINPKRPHLIRFDKMFVAIYECLGFPEKAESSYNTSEILYPGVKEGRKYCQDWIKRYEMEENRGIKILQRQRRLEEEGECVIATSSNENGNWLEDNPPNYESTPDQQSQ